MTFYFSDYDYQIKFGNDSQNKFDWNASIENISLKPEFSYFINPGNLLKFGGQSILYTFDPGNAVGISEGEERDFSLPQKYAMENALYVENEIDLTTKIKANYGLRLSSFTYLGKGTAFEYADGIPGERRFVTSATEYDDWEAIETYYNLEPRLSLQMQLGDNNSMKASYNRTSQYIHLVSNTTAATPVDVWTPSTNNIKPSTADQRFDQLHNLSVTAFYDINDRWTTSANFAFNTGSPTTFPTSRYTVQDFVVPHNANDTRNNVRLPNYHRLDLSVTRKGKVKEGKRWTGDWVLSVYNVYNRRNPFSIFFAQEDGRIPVGSPVNTDAYKLSVIGSFIPAISYNFKFQ